MTYLASWRGHFELLPYPPHPAEIFLRLTRTQRWLDLQLDRVPHLVVIEIPDRATWRATLRCLQKSPE